MTNVKLHERLLELPLFQGMSRNDIKQVVTSTRFKHISYAEGKVIVSEGDICDRLLFLIDGIIDATGRADDNGYSITERLYAPGILQPERIFGLTQRFTRTFMAAGNCRFISLDKIDALALADSYETFRLNLLNIICTKSQRLTRYPWRIQPKDIRSKIVRFIEARSLRPAGEKTMTITMERLGLELGESRLNVSRELNAMDNEGAISLRRGRIHIAALERLINTTT